MECIALGHGRKMICRGRPRLAILYALLMTVWLDASHIHMQAFPVPLPLQVQGTSAELPHLSSFQFSWHVTGGFPLYC